MFGRDDLVLETREKEDRNLCYGGNDGFGRPDLMAEEGEVARWWDNTVMVRYWPSKSNPGYSRRDKFPHRQKCVLEY
jgi:hypothetical protein